MRNAPIFTRLRVWQEAHRLALSVYKHTAAFPSHERFDLTSQLRRSAVSVGANIAEGYGRRTRGDIVRMLVIARGSLMETQQHLLFAGDLGYLTPSAVGQLLDEYQGLAAALAKFQTYVEQKRVER